MKFEEAITKLKEGHMVTNRNWNGKDMFLFRQMGYPDGVPANENTSKAMNIPLHMEVCVEPYIMMKNASGFLVPWIPSQMDIFSDGWEIVDGDKI
jgi:hypothetical protein